MDYIHWAVLLVTLTQIIIVSAYVWISHRLRLTHKELDAAYKVVKLIVANIKEQDLQIALLLKLQGIEIEGYEVTTSPEEAIAKIFESMGETADDLKPEDFN